MEKEVADQTRESLSAAGGPENQAGDGPADRAREEEEENRQAGAGMPGPAENQAVDDGFEEGQESEGAPQEEELLTAQQSAPESGLPTGVGRPQGVSAQEVMEALTDLRSWREGAGGRPETPTEEQSPANVSSEELEGDDQETSRQRPSTLQRQPGLEHLVEQPAEEQQRQAQTGSERQLRLQGLLDSLQQENTDLQMLCAALKREKSELARMVQQMQGQLQSSSEECLSLKAELDALREDETGGAGRGKASGCTPEMSAEEWAQTAEQEAAFAKAQLTAVLEKYDRVEKDNQAMADEIHHFREEIGRLQQCPSQTSSCRSRISMMGLVFLFGLFYYWCVAEEWK